ncbi:hypothetical protein MKK68_16600 [Methylobacterium sp. E-016]|uniref:DNA-directed RNA polymerase n=1 Tax=Methylobacterium sp. E-016 TaxID=2836556 RepID=UPI001FB88257|nr:DNA-directed RNA polymerase [Methylobacterium sp. E-016]MCJ2077247.1 hypothetical protein [Methylobacterium sp. E-016]
MEAANYLQAIPWRVNQRLLEVALEAWHRDLAIAALPSQVSLRSTVLPLDAAADPQAVIGWYQQAVHVAANEYSRSSAVRLVEPVLAAAEQYAGFERFYFPQALKGGGLIPVAGGFGPDDLDLPRALIEFADGQAVTQGRSGGNGGDGWIAIQLSACFGIKTKDHDARIAWVFDREEQFRRTASNPLANLEWTHAERPWSALAAIFDFVAFLEEGYGYVSRLPISASGGRNFRPELVYTAVRTARDSDVAIGGLVPDACVIHAANGWRIQAIYDDMRAASQEMTKATLVLANLLHLQQTQPEHVLLAELDYWHRRSRGEFDTAKPIGSASAAL